MQIWSLGQEDPLEDKMATHSSVFAWKVPWNREAWCASPWGRKESDMTEQLSVHPSFFQCLCVLVVSNSLRPHGLYRLPGFSVHGIIQARMPEWVAISPSRGSSWPRDWTQVFCIAGGCSTDWTTREALLPMPKTLHLGVRLATTSLLWTLFIASINIVLLSRAMQIFSISLRACEAVYYPLLPSCGEDGLFSDKVVRIHLPPFSVNFPWNSSKAMFRAMSSNVLGRHKVYGSIFTFGFFFFFSCFVK